MNSAALQLISKHFSCISDIYAGLIERCDRYVEDILQNTSVKVENVTIEPGGSWVETVRSTQKNTRGESKHSQDDGAAATAGTSLKRRRSTDVLAAEVIDLEVDPPKKKIVVLNLHAKPVTATPKSPKSTAITAQSAVGSPSRKSTPLFVDLTNSSDDEDTGEEFGIDLRNGKRASTEDTAAKNAFHTPVSLDSSEHGFHGEDRADTMWHGPTSMLPTGASLPFRQDDFYP